VVVIRGEFVVDCVANVVVKTPVFEARKIRQGFELYFAIVAISAMKELAASQISAKTDLSQDRFEPRQI
jgi:hypothetical protein